jgi:small subunit ribosomal protein S15
MAKMHSRKKGNARSKKPAMAAKWVEYQGKEVEDLVLKLRKGGMNSAAIGRLLRDQYGIPSVKDVTKKTIGHILEENKLTPKMPEDLYNLLKKAVELRNHMEKHKKDYTSKHGLELLESKVRRLVKYYVREGKLPRGFTYEPERAKLLVETEKS